MLSNLDVSVENPKVAVILPVYNVEQYLKECLESIVCQTYKNFIVFAVDDGSTDRSGKIFDEFGEKDSRFCINHKLNGGVSSARNLALEMMEAFPCAFDLVCFVDGDDIIKPHFIRNYVDHFQNNSVDYVVCGWNPFDKVGIVDHGRERHLDVITSNSGAYRHLFLIGEWKGRLPVSFAYFLSNKCFSARVLYGLRFDESLSRGEDLDFVIRSLLNVKKALIGSAINYMYRLRQSSLSHGSEQPIVDEMYVYVLLLRKIAKMPPDVRTFIEQRAHELWWGSIRRTIEAKVYGEYKKQIYEAYKILLSSCSVMTLPNKFKRRFLCYLAGEKFLNLYFRGRVKSESVISTNLFE